MAWFTFTDSSNEIFLVELHDRELVSHARKLLDGTETSDALIAGIVIKTPTDYNIGWSYHLAPKSIFFFEFSTEVGDSTMRFIEDHLAEVGGDLLPGQRVDALDVEACKRTDRTVRDRAARCHSRFGEGGYRVWKSRQ